MQVKLNKDLYNEIQHHYQKSIVGEEFKLGEINCWAYTSSGREDDSIPIDEPMFCFVKPFGKPVYSAIDPEIVFDTVEYAFIKGDEVIYHPSEIREMQEHHCEDCSC